MILSTEPLVTKLWYDVISSPGTNCSRFKANIGPLESASIQDLWKNIPFFSKLLSMFPNTFVRVSTESIKTGVL